MHLRKQWIWGIIVLLVLAAAGAGGWYWWMKNGARGTAKPQALIPVKSAASIKDSYDVIVAGTDPEGISAAISAARNGQKVLLVDGRGREILGGLMTLGWLNTIDLNYAPEQPVIPGKHNFLDKGIFQEWYERVEGTSFDTTTAANVFYDMVRKEPNIDLLMKVKEMKPSVEPGTPANKVTGLDIVKEDGTKIAVKAKAVIDATQDADIAAAAGAPFTWGREDIGDPKSQMAVTLVMKLSGVTPQVWQSFGKHKNTQSDATSTWGFPEMKEYKSTNPERVRMRGLNIGRQNDNTILINAMQIFGVDPLNPQSVKEGIEIGKKEAPHVVEYMKQHFPEFKNLELVGTAPELYVRETRHLIGEYRLTMADLMDNRDFPDAIAYGSYEVDIQSTNYKDPGAVMMKPIQYGVPFRTLVPQKVDGLLVVGRAASFDSLPHGSARVIPLGMATGQAAGAAAKLAADKGITFRQLSQSSEDIAALREKLVQQKMELKMYKFDAPEYTKHKAYPGLKAAVGMFLTVGGYNNKDWEVDGASNAQRFVYNMAGIRKIKPAVFPGDPSAALVGMADPAKQALTLNQAALTIGTAIGLKPPQQKTAEELKARGWLTQETLSKIADPNKLTNGEAFLLLRDVAKNYAQMNIE
ncbi:FAD-dependent oxidoreductase [Paenibacillus filicis]|uniref:FAD-dependent oxidoreductase n=1 Tax=Paenibacillus gyeongsangnamensis TaxID=3388067 RepID=A0ABT4QGF1_9BACL|nr:FAD-dependent oxidoreductase [Paenibacillus filicis]MCZ8515948.1 FAD-dependent oxidoreductase [Paenibacillus filicis]